MRTHVYKKTLGKRNRTRHVINAEREVLHVAKGDTVKVVPATGSLRTSIRPPCARTIESAIASPNPWAPPVTRAVWPSSS